MSCLKLSFIYLCMTFFVCLACSKKIKLPVASHDGVEINYFEEGNGDISLLFIHGWGNNYTIWDRQIAHFSKNYRVVAIDLPGYGKSGVNRQDWSVSAFGNDICTIIDKLDLEKVVVVGFSMGAGIAVEAANEDSTKILGVILVDNMQNIELKYEPKFISHMDSLFMDLALNPTKEKILGGGFIKKDLDESYQKLVNMLNENEKIGWSESLKAYFKWLNYSCVEALENINVPIISINSDNQPTNVEAFKKYIDSFTLKTVSDTGHVIMWDQTDEFNRLLEESILEFLE